jgi:glyoxylase I family protein
MAQTVRHLGVQHVGMAFDDLEAARAFYEDVLGFRPLERPSSNTGIPGLWFGLGNGQMVHLAQRQPDPRVPIQHFALSVDDLDAVVDDLEARGVAVRRRPHVDGYGYQAFVDDPSGNIVEFNQLDTGPLGCELPVRLSAVPTPRQVAERYIELVNQRDLAGIVDLFAEDGMVEPPNPAYARRIQGIEALTAHYANSVGRRKPNLTVTNWYVSGRVCIVELESEVNDSPDPMGVVDVFELDDSAKIRRLTAYRR